MDVAFSEEQTLLRESARAFLARECPMSRVREGLEKPPGLDEDFWKQLAELGWTGLALPAEFGGAGLGWLELALVLEEMGRRLAPGPFLSHSIGSAALARGLPRARRRELLPALADGTRRATFGHFEPRRGLRAQDGGVSAERVGGALRLVGSELFVFDADCAHWLVIPARLDDRTELFLVDAAAAGVELRPVAWVDPTRRPYELQLAGVELAESARLEGGSALVERVLDLARVAVCAELCGIAAAALERSVAYARSREQFGRPIGSFQAVQHRCADMLVRLEAARSATWDAAWALANETDDAHAAACMAKAWCSEACTRVAGDAIQIHGGLGFTWEQDPQLYFKRAQADALAWGDASWCREQVARELLDPQRGRG